MYCSADGVLYGCRDVKQVIRVEGLCWRPLQQVLERAMPALVGVLPNGVIRIIAEYGR